MALNPFIGPKRNFFMGQLTLPLANTPYNICDLIDAVVQAEGGTAVNSGVARTSRLFYVESFPGIGGVGGNTNDVLLGEQIAANSGSLLTNARFGRVLAAAGGGFTFQGTFQNVDHGNYVVQSAGVGQKIDVIVSNG